ncbi:MAG: regulator [Microbacteriaceae bacterium]
MTTPAHAATEEPTLALALALDRRTEERLLPEIESAGLDVVARVHSAAELVAECSRRRPDVVLVSAARRTLTAQLISRCDASAIRVVAVTASDLERRHAASLGLYEVVEAQAPWAEIRALLVAGVVIPQRLGGPIDRAAGRGTVIAVWGPQGAPGRTTLAVNIAAEIAALGHTVTLADIDTYGGAVAPCLGMLDEAPGFAAACRLAGNDTLTLAELERVAQRYSSPRGSFWVLTGIGAPSRWPELSGDRVAKTLDACRHWAEYVVLDTGFSLEHDEEISSDLFAPRRNAATLAALRAADRIIAVGSADPVGVARFLRSHADLLQTAADASVSVVMNRVRSSAVGVNPFGQISSTLARFGGIDAPVLVPDDQQGLDAAVLTGQTLRDTAPKSAARSAILRLVESTLVPSPTAARSGARRAPVLRSRRRAVQASG